MTGSRSTRPVVVMIIPWLRQYVTTFFGLLRERLDDEGVDFELIYGTPRASSGGRGDTADLPWAHHVEQHDLALGRYSVNWQPYVRWARGADLVIVQQATRDLLNYVLFAHQAVGGPKVAFWGHGRSFFASTATQRASERVKRSLTRRSHWFFAYNDLASSILIDNGYPPDRITSIGNTLDTKALEDARDRVSAEDKERVAVELGLEGRNVGIYCGALYKEKRISFLIEAAREIRSEVPDFELIVAGGGVDQHVAAEADEAHEWIHYVGPQFGDSLAVLFSVSDLFLLPGAVGLAVIDSFVFETPMVTVSSGTHGPEIAYLESGVNGIVVDGDGSDGEYVEAVVSVLTDEDRRLSLVEGCRRSVSQHSLDSMVDRFAEGVLTALAT